MGKIVEIEGVNKIYGSNHVVKDLNTSWFFRMWKDHNTQNDCRL